MLFLLLGIAFSASNWLFIGDSLTEGYGLSKINAYPALIEKKWNEEHPEKKIKIWNAGVSGATSASALATFEFYKKKDIDLIFLALGANDGLRGQSTSNLKNNLRTIIEKAKKENIPIVLIGMKIPQNYGKEYVGGFQKVYSDLANTYKLHFYPFLLEGVAGKKKYNLKDGLHPNEEGYKIIADKIYLFLKEKL